MADEHELLILPNRGGGRCARLHRHHHVAAWPQPTELPGTDPQQWGCPEGMRHHHGDKWPGA